LYGNDAVLVERQGGEDGGKTPYDEFLASFWSGIQGDVTPTCIFEPRVAADLSVLILISRFTQCPFAVRSGGHAAFTGASNIEDGITVSLARFTDVSLSEDHKIAAVGAGNIWGPVYEYLEPYNLTVIGGRLYNVGVGGLTLGGEISPHSVVHRQIDLALQAVYPTSPTSMDGPATM
jgi:FAD/FMN-containing dehydrogenase